MYDMYTSAPAFPPVDDPPWRRPGVGICQGGGGGIVRGAGLRSCSLLDTVYWKPPCLPNLLDLGTILQLSWHAYELYILNVSRSKVPLRSILHTYSPGYQCVLGSQLFDGFMGGHRVKFTHPIDDDTEYHLYENLDVTYWKLDSVVLIHT